MNYKTTAEIELAIAEFFNIRQHMIVPNIWWGMGLIHECDLFIVTKNGYVTEVEIKINRYDLKKDQKKWHKHQSNMIKRLFFAIPPELSEFRNYIPERAGIIVVYGPNDECPYIKKYSGPYCKVERPAQINRAAKTLTDKEMLHLGRLAAMRIWSLNRALIERKYEEEIIIC